MALITVNLRLVSPYGENDIAKPAAGQVRFTPVAHGKLNGALRTIETVNASVIQGVMNPVELTPGAWKVEVLPTRGNPWPAVTVTLEEGMEEPVNLAELAPEIVFNGEQLAKGDPGPAIVDWIDNGDGTVSFVLEDDTTIGPGRMPRGPQGVQGPAGPPVEGIEDVPGLQESLDQAGAGVSVLAFGATGDGATDDTAAFTAAFASGDPVYVPGGTYMVSGAYASGPVDLTLAADAVIQHDATGPGILIEGTETPAQTDAGIVLNGDVEAGSSSFDAPGHGLAPGDYFRLGSELPWDASSTNIRQGEILRVATVSDSGFTSTTPVMGGPYMQSDTAAIWRLGMIEGVTIRGGTIRGPRTPNLVQTGLLIRRARDVEVVGTRFESIDYRHISLEDVVDGHIVRTDHDWAQDAGMAYGIAVTGACQNVTISRGTFVDTRHAVTTSNLMAVRGVARFLTVSDCVVRRTLPALNEDQSGGDAFDTHTAADYVTFDRNVVEGSSGGGINVECRHSRVRWNTIIAPTGTGIHVHNESDYDGSTEILGNHVVAGPVTTYGIRVSPASRGSGKTLRGVIVTANTVKGVQSTPIYMGSAANAPLYAVALNGNVFVDCPGAYMVRQVNGYGVAATGNTSDMGQAPLRLEDNAPKGDDAGFEYGRFDGETITVTPTGRYIQLTGSTGDQSLTTINGAARGQFITLIAPLNGNRITISTAGHIHLPTPLSIAGREAVTLAYNGFTWSEVNRSHTATIA